MDHQNENFSSFASRLYQEKKKMNPNYRWHDAQRDASQMFKKRARDADPVDNLSMKRRHMSQGSRKRFQQLKTRLEKQLFGVSKSTAMSRSPTPEIVPTSSPPRRRNTRATQKQREKLNKAFSLTDFGGGYKW